jgi:hypothetical protein
MYQARIVHHYYRPTKRKSNIIIFIVFYTCTGCITECVNGTYCNVTVSECRNCSDVISHCTSCNVTTEASDTTSSPDSDDVIEVVCSECYHDYEMKEDGSQCVINSNTDEQSVPVAAIVVPIVLVAGVAVFLVGKIRGRKKPDNKKYIDDQLDNPVDEKTHGFDSQDRYQDHQDHGKLSSEPHYMVCRKSLLTKLFI